MNIKKIAILLAVVLSLVFLLGSIGPSPRPQIHDPNSESNWTTCSISRERIVKYEIVDAPNSTTLVSKVNEKLKDKNNNWIPIGGISVDNTKYHQAMIIVK